MFNLYSTPDLKAAVDDALPWTMDNLGFSQNYMYEFIRLGLSYTAVAAAALTFWIEKKRGFDSAFNVIATCVVVYFGCLSAAYLWFRLVERRATYIGSKSGEVIYVRTDAPKHMGTYVVYCETPQGSLSKTVPFQELVDFNGHVAQSKLQPLIAELVKVKAD